MISFFVKLLSINFELFYSKNRLVSLILQLLFFRIINCLRVDRDLSRTIVHVDMDMFYAAVEIRDNPALRGVPMAVGGMGMLTTSNYEARNSVVMNAENLKVQLKLFPGDREPV